MLYQEAHVSRILLSFPQRAVESLCCLAASAIGSSDPRLAGQRMQPLFRLAIGLWLMLGRKVVKLAFLFYFYHAQLYSQSIIRHREGP